jgi:16S rRNA (guanine527-N7)-methyltransferase
MAAGWPACTVVLLDAGARRTEFLRQAVTTCGLAERVSVVHQRAEEAGREPSYREAFDGVVARSFGSPAVVAECAAPLLRPGGWLMVSEPPESSAGEGTDAQRWPSEPLLRLGMEPGAFVREEFGFQILWQRAPCPDRYPRRNGVPSKQPLF